jgi:hypothetical protein
MNIICVPTCSNYLPQKIERILLKEHDLNSIDLLHDTLITIIIIVADIEEHVKAKNVHSLPFAFRPSISIDVHELRMHGAILNVCSNNH